MSGANGPDLRLDSDLGIPASVPFVRGVDVSHFQSDQKAIDFDALAKVARFAFVREGESDWREGDLQFPINWPGARRTIKRVGPYHPPHANADGRTQARILRDRCRDFRAGVDLPPMVDVEVAGPGLLHVCEDFADEACKLFGVRFLIVYVGKWFARDIGLTSASPLAKMPCCVAAYTGFPPAFPDAFAPELRLFWQVTGSGTAAGVATKVDLDVFFGTEADLDALIAHSAVSPPAVEQAPAGHDATLESAAALAATGWEGET